MPYADDTPQLSSCTSNEHKTLPNLTLVNVGGMAVQGVELHLIAQGSLVQSWADVLMLFINKIYFTKCTY